MRITLAAPLTAWLGLLGMPGTTAWVGTTSPPLMMATCRRTLTNWPGHRALSSFGNVAFSRIVPVVA